MDAWLRHSLLIVGLAAASAVSAAAQATEERPSDVTPAALAEGKKLFQGAGLCSACHGADATGGVGPSLADGTWLHGDGSYEAIRSRITEGVPADQAKTGIPMPPKGGASLNEEQVRAIAAYVWSISRPQP